MGMSSSYRSLLIPATLYKCADKDGDLDAWKFVQYQQNLANDCNSSSSSDDDKLLVDSVSSENHEATASEQCRRRPKCSGTTRDIRGFSSREYGWLGYSPQY